VKLTLTDRRKTVLTAIHEHGPAAPSTICHATGHAPGEVRLTLGLFLRLGWLASSPHPDRPGVAVYHLTDRGLAGLGLKPKEPTA
jgi:DNA-binding IclR family transcriptional regulator